MGQRGGRTKKKPPKVKVHWNRQSTEGRPTVGRWSTESEVLLVNPCVPFVVVSSPLGEDFDCMKGVPRISHTDFPFIHTSATLKNTRFIESFEDWGDIRRVYTAATLARDRYNIGQDPRQVFRDHRRLRTRKNSTNCVQYHDVPTDIGLLTLSLLRVINVKFPMKPPRK